jgi:hypothetical protein
MVKVSPGVLSRMPRMTVNRLLFPLMRLVMGLAEVISGKFCRWFGPSSESGGGSRSFEVTPGGLVVN